MINLHESMINIFLSISSNFCFGLFFLSTQNMCFGWEKRKLIFNYDSYLEAWLLTFLSTKKIHKHYLYLWMIDYYGISIMITVKPV